MKSILLCTGLLLTPLAWAESVDQIHSLNADARVEVSNLRGEIRVVGSERSDLRISGEIGEGAKGLIVEGGADRLEIRVDYPNSQGWGLFGAKIGDSRLLLELPRGVSLQAESVSADIRVEAVDGKRVELESVSGDLDYQGGTDYLDAETVSGDIVLEAPQAARVELESVSGDIRLRGLGGDRLEAETVSGRIDLQLDVAPRTLGTSAVSGDTEIHLQRLDSASQLDLEAMSGGIRLRLPASAGASVEVETFNGRIDSPFGEVEKDDYGSGQRMKARLGEGGASVRIETFSGDIAIQTF